MQVVKVSLHTVVAHLHSHPALQYFTCVHAPNRI